MPDEYAYAPGGILVDRTSNMNDLIALISVDHPNPLLGKLLPHNIAKYDTDYLKSIDTYKVVKTGAASDEFQRKTGETDVGLQPDDTWAVTEDFADVSLPDAQTQLKGDVQNVSLTGQIEHVSRSDQLKVIGRALKVLLLGVNGLAEVEWGADRSTWPAKAKAWDNMVEAITADFAQLLKVEQTRDVEIAKQAEIDALADMTAVRAYDTKTGWPDGTIPPDIP
jgi:hypothetical protein